MKLSPAGIHFIKQFEGLRLKAYKCAAGVWTVGYGNTGPDVGPTTEITSAEAEKRFINTLFNVEYEVKDRLKVQVNQNEFDALVSFTYNIGINAFSSSTLLKLLNSGATKQIVASEFFRWVKGSDGNPIEGLRIRRAKEKELFLTKPINTALAHSILAQRDTWLKREPLAATDLPAERKLFVPKGSAHIWESIIMVPGESHYKVVLEAQPESTWWIYPSHWKIINDPKPEPEQVYKHPSKLILEVPYYSQRDNTKDPMRTCFSSSCAMLLKFLKPNSITGDDQYIRTVFKYGDTTSSSAQLLALEEYGVKADFSQNGGWSSIDSQLTRGIPIPIGILHKGPVTNPTGGGHWIVIIGRNEDNTAYVVHDPFGDLDLVNGGYLSSDGAFKVYSKKNLGPRWLVESQSSGWFVRASK